MEFQAKQNLTCLCIVCDLLKKSFTSRDFTSKKIIVEKGRNIPNLDITRKVKNYVRKFNNQMFIDNEWLTGCSAVQRVYCWPCLLFSNEKNVWNTHGYNDVTNIHKAVKKHSISESHLQTSLSIKTFGKTRIDLLLSDQKRIRENQHNKLVDKNREIFER